MAEASKIRLVRCPKCGNLLPEHPDYSVYQCGGCGALLKAKKMGSINAGFLENSSKEKKEERRLGSLSETETESDKDQVFVRGNVDLVGVSSSRTEKEGFLVGNDDVNVEEKIKGSRHDPNDFERKIWYVDNCSQSSKHPIDDRVGEDDHHMNLNRSKFVNSSVVEGIGDVSAHLRNSSEVMRSRVVVDNWGVERVGFWGFDEDLRPDANHSRFSPFVHSDEGSSEYKPNSFFTNSKPVKNFHYRDEANVAETLELSRAGFNRKLHDLKEQISKLEGKPKENTLDDRNMGPSESYRDPAACNVSMQPFLGDNHVVRPPNFNHSVGPAPFMNDHNLDMHNFYPPPRRVPRMMPRSNYENPLWSPKLNRPHNQPPPQYPQPPPLDYYLGRYMDFNRGVLASYPREPFLHQPACPCLHCGHKNWQVPPVAPQTGFSCGRLAQSNFYHRANPVEFGPRNDVTRGSFPPPLHSQYSQLPMRWPINIDSDDTFYHSHPRRVVVSHENKRLCHPIAGGAPFMLCRNCSELLKLPSKVMAVANNPQKLQCGTCLTSYSFEIRNKRLIISISVETEEISGEADDVSRDPLNGDILRAHVCSTAGGTNSCSIDFDSGYDFQSADTKQNLLLDQISNLSEPEKRKALASSSSISKEEEKGLNSVIVQNDVSNSAELPSKYDMPPAGSGSPLRNHFNDSASIHVVTGSGIGNRSKRTDQEKVVLVLNKTASQQNCEKDASMETEAEVSFSEYLNANLSHDSVEVSTENQLRIDKGHKTFLMGLIKKSFRDFSRSTQCTESGRPNVSVNGQQIPTRLIKKAEKLAGPIEPGHYWYDSRAGFWGVMRQPCHGIITPYIEEFNYPMLENCAAGNTSVFVNGRELHQTDLDLLTRRGLPAIRNKKYIIEICGRVLDEDSGEELDCLGKLAPTVEKVKRGFGLRVPKVAL